MSLSFQVPELLKISFVDLEDLSPEIQDQAEWIFGDLVVEKFELWSDGVLVPAFVYHEEIVLRPVAHHLSENVSS